MADPGAAGAAPGGGPDAAKQGSSSLRNELELVTEDELARLLKVCRRQLHSWQTRGFIPYFEIGKAVRFRMVEALESLEQMRRLQNRNKF